MGLGLKLSLRLSADKRMLDFCTPILFGSSKIISAHKKILEMELPIYKVFSLDKITHGKINVLDIWNEDLVIQMGKPTKEGGRYAFLSLESATKALRDRSIDVLVTAPINKDTIQSRILITLDIQNI